jgi:hypothetical protein
MIDGARGLGLVVASTLVFGCSDRKAQGGETGAGESGESTESTGLIPEDVAGTDSDCEPILQADGAASGFEQCMDGELIRTSAQTCTDPFPPSDAGVCAYGSCSTDDDCKDAPYGSCQIKGDFPALCGCEHGCTNDDECGPGFACMCAPIDAGTLCIEAGCRSDADCPDGYPCVLSPSYWWTPPSLHCHSAIDQCQSDADCPEGTCRWRDGGWKC